MSEIDVCTALVRWLSTFHLESPHESLSDLSDGVAMAQALRQIAPEYFSEMWFNKKIKTDAAGKWRLKVSNIRKLIDGLVDYYQEFFNQQILEYGKPDATKIGERADPEEFSKLLQLILGCAVKCNKKENYIQKIMQLEETVQNAIMRSIQDLEASLSAATLSLNSTLQAQSENHIHQLMNELRTASEDRDQLAQRCLELDAQLNLTLDEKAALEEEKRILEDRLQDIMVDPKSDMYAMRRQNEKLKGEKLELEFKLESAKDESAIKMEAKEKEINALQKKIDVLQQDEAEAQRLKDENDVLREKSDKVEKLENDIKSYKERLKEMNDLKKALNALERDNNSYYQSLEDEKKKVSAGKAQIEIYKKQAIELRNSLLEESKKSDKLAYEKSKVVEKMEEVVADKERLISERDSLRNANQLLELKLAKNGDTFGENCELLLSGNAMSPTEMKLELVRLQRENSALKSNPVKIEPEKIHLLEMNVDDITRENTQLRLESRQANQRILELEARVKELSRDGRCDSPDVNDLRTQLEYEKSRCAAIITEREKQMMEMKQLNSILRETIGEKDQEIQEFEDKQKKYIERAQAIEKTIDSAQYFASEIESLRTRLREQEKLNESLTREKESLKRESLLMSSAFHNMSQQRQRESLDHHIINSVNMPYLARQRQSGPLKMRSPFSSK